MTALAGGNYESWQSGQSFELALDLRVDVLQPASDSTETRADDRALVLLFETGGQTLLWAGRIGVKTQRDLITRYPGLHADVLVMAADTRPDDAWLESLRVRHWLQLPPRESWLNATGSASVLGGSCKIWPLNETGAVDVHFQPVRDRQPAAILLRPWLALPAEPTSQ